MHWNNSERNPFPPVCKVIRRHFLSYHTDDKKSEIESKLPDLKYIWLRRENNYERAISLYFSLVDKLWRTDKDGKKELLQRVNSEQKKFDPFLAISCYAEVSSSYHNDWFDYLKNTEYLEINYQQLIIDPKEELKKIVNYLGINVENYMFVPPDSGSMKRSQTDEFIVELKSLLKKKSIPSVPQKSDINIYKLLYSNT